MIWGLAMSSNREAKAFREVKAYQLLDLELLSDGCERECYVKEPEELDSHKASPTMRYLLPNGNKEGGIYLLLILLGKTWEALVFPSCIR